MFVYFNLSCTSKTKNNEKKVNVMVDLVQKKNLMKKKVVKEKRRINKANIVRYIQQRGETSKTEIATALNVSLPTVLRYASELISENMINEVGIYESTGGRKASRFSINEALKYAIGVDITAHHVNVVVVNFKKDIIINERLQIDFQNKEEYYAGLSAYLTKITSENAIDSERILGVGISLPGIVDKRNHVVRWSHVLGMRDFDLEMIRNYFHYPVHFENDAVSAAAAEISYLKQNMVYLSLSNTVGGAIYINGSIFEGNEFKSGEFGHMILHPDGNMCYCGKKGCVDAYCNAELLSGMTYGRLENFFSELEAGNPLLQATWDEYLEDLALTISNLRMVFDCNIILGGYVGAFLEPYMPELKKRVAKYNLFNGDVERIYACRYKYAAAALGGAVYFIDDYVDGL